MKAYNKPMFYVESFELMEHIAGDCTENMFGLATHRGIDKCEIEVNKVGDKFDLVFVDPNRCTLPFDSLDLGEICYQGTFMEGAHAFAS